MTGSTDDGNGGLQGASIVRLLVVSPMHNERSNVEGLLSAMSAQTKKDFTWIVVDDGSDDGTADILRELDTEGLARVVSKDNDGGLIGGSAFTSWTHGVELGLREDPSITHVMKLDADVRLAPNYLQRVTDIYAHDSRVGLAGGLISTVGMREQSHHIPGPVKMYSVDAYRLALTELPRAIGFDIMDEVLLRSRGFTVTVDRNARFEMSREVGLSEGELHGRYRHGRGCRWTGYFFPYFLLRCLRYLIRRPYVFGSVAMFWGYLTAGSGPYPGELKRRHASMQRDKLKRLIRNPVRFLRETYG